MHNTTINIIQSKLNMISDLRERWTDLRVLCSDQESSPKLFSRDLVTER